MGVIYAHVSADASEGQGTGSPGAEVTGGYGCQGPLQEQYTPFTTEPSISPAPNHYTVFKNMSGEKVTDTFKCIFLFNKHTKIKML